MKKLVAFAAVIAAVSFASCLHLYALGQKILEVAAWRRFKEKRAMLL